MCWGGGSPQPAPGQCWVIAESDEPSPDYQCEFHETSVSSSSTKISNKPSNKLNISYTCITMTDLKLYLLEEIFLSFHKASPGCQIAPEVSSRKKNYK